MKNSGKCVGTIVAGGEMGLHSQSVEREYQIVYGSRFPTRSDG